jgi:uncharacterized protein (TIGR02246 family)
MTPSADGQDAARDLYEGLLAAWNGRDATAFADLFAADGTMIGFDGSQATGPEIRDLLEPIFRDHPTAAYVAKIREVRSIGPDAALLRAIVGMVPPGQDRLNPETNAVQSVVAGRGDEGWSIVLFQNTPAQYHGRPDLAGRHTEEIEQLRSGR